MSSIIIMLGSSSASLTLTSTSSPIFINLQIMIIVNKWSINAHNFISDSAMLFFCGCHLSTIIKDIPHKNSCISKNMFLMRKHPRWFPFNLELHSNLRQTYRNTSLHFDCITVFENYANILVKKCYLKNVTTERKIFIIRRQCKGTNTKLKIVTKCSIWYERYILEVR